MKKKVSVVIPVKDRPLELLRTLNSVLVQTMDNFEIVIVENNSSRPNEIVDLIDSLNCEKISLFHLRECDNANVARNYGALKSTGDYIAFLDSDDEWLPNHLSDSLLVLENSCADFVYGGAIVFDGVNESYKIARNLSLKETPADYLVGFNRGYAQTSSYIMKRNVFLNVLWDESLKRTQDLDFFIRVYKAYSCTCTELFTSRINWISGEKRDVDIPSMLKFFKKNKKEMAFSSKVRYLLIIISNIKSIKDLKFLVIKD